MIWDHVVDKMKLNLIKKFKKLFLAFSHNCQHFHKINTIFIYTFQHKIKGVTVTYICFKFYTVFILPLQIRCKIEVWSTHFLGYLTAIIISKLNQNLKFPYLFKRSECDRQCKTGTRTQDNRLWIECSKKST